MIPSCCSHRRSIGRLKAMLCLVPLAVALPARSQEARGSDEAPLEDVVVTATRSARPLATAPGSVSVVTAKEIGKRDAQSIDGVLKSVPGFYSRREQEFSTLQPTINLRGIAGQNRTLILLDGISLNEPRTGAGYFDGVPVDDVERIEVVKGPFSSLYGGYAMAGVVNVITRMPQKLEVVAKGGYGSGFQSGTAYDHTGRVYVSVGNRFADRLSVLASYGRSWTDGYPYQLAVVSSKPASGYSGYQTTTSNTGAAAYVIGDKGNASSWYDGLTLKAQYDFSKSTRLGFSFLRNNYRTDYGAPHTLLTDSSGTAAFSDGTSKISESAYLATASGRIRNLYDLHLDTLLASVQTRVTLSLVDQALSYNRTPGSAATQSGGSGTYLDAPAKEYGVDLQFTAPPWFHQIVTWGGTFKRDSTDSSTYVLSNWLYESSKTTLSSSQGGFALTYALFAQDEILLRDDLTVYLGARVDWWDTHDGYNSAAQFPSRTATSLSPKAAVVYRPWAATTLRASGGKAFRAPTIYELYANYTGTVSTIANADLQPETTWSWDASLEQELWAGAKGAITYFSNHLSDLIYTKTLSATQQQRTNVGAAESFGVELNLEQRLRSWLRLAGDYTYTDASITEDAADPTVVGKRMVDVPKHLLNLSAEVTRGPVTGTLTGRYVDKRFSTDRNTDTVSGVYTSYDPFFTADVKVGYSVTDRMGVYLSVNNLFDNTYYTYYLSPRRSWFGELVVKL